MKVIESRFYVHSDVKLNVYISRKTKKRSIDKNSQRVKEEIQRTAMTQLQTDENRNTTDSNSCNVANCP